MDIVYQMIQSTNFKVAFCTDAAEYINDYEKLEGIKLEKNKICVNEGLRSISKLLLNSMWGRYCLQTKKIKYSMISNLKDLYSYLLNDLYEIQDIHFLNDCKTKLFYSEKEQLHSGGKDSNIILELCDVLWTFKNL